MTLTLLLPGLTRLPVKSAMSVSLADDDNDDLCVMIAAYVIVTPVSELLAANIFIPRASINVTTADALTRHN